MFQCDSGVAKHSYDNVVAFQCLQTKNHLVSQLPQNSRSLPNLTFLTVRCFISSSSPKIRVHISNARTSRLPCLYMYKNASQAESEQVLRPFWIFMSYCTPSQQMTFVRITVSPFWTLSKELASRKNSTQNNSGNYKRTLKIRLTRVTS